MATTILYTRLLQPDYIVALLIPPTCKQQQPVEIIFVLQLGCLCRWYSGLVAGLPYKNYVTHQISFLLFREHKDYCLFLILQVESLETNDDL
jgi:hypothetical protein